MKRSSIPEWRGRGRLQLVSLALILSLLFGSPTLAAGEDYKHWADKPPAGWQNGALQSSNSNYAEGEVVPHYFTSSSLTVETTYAFNIYYDYYDSGKNACGFDYLSEYNTSRATTFVGGTPTPDTAPPMPGGGSNYFYVVGADITAVSGPITTGIRQYVQVTFTATATKAEFYWGLHLAMDNAVGTCQGASNWSGASAQTDVSASPSVPGATMIGGGGTMSINPSGVLPAGVAGYKWNDVNANGTLDSGETKIPNWPILLYSCNNQACGTATLHSTRNTDGDGNYVFTNLTAGSWYRVCEGVQSGWKRTFPAGSECHTTFQAVTGTTFTYPFGNRIIDLAGAKTCPSQNDYDTNPPPYKFTFTVTNQATVDGYAASSASGVNFSDTLQAGVYLAPCNWIPGYPWSPPNPGTNWYTTSLTNASCTYTGNPGASVTCSLTTPNTLAAGATWTVEICFTFPPDYPHSISNSAVADSDWPLGNEKYRSNNDGTCSTTTPVSLAYFGSARGANGLRFEWSTATEVGNLGFNLYALREAGRQRLNAEMIPSAAVTSFEPQAYSFEAAGVGATTFMLEEVAVTGKTRLHGPFALGETYGARPLRSAVDWPAIQAEHQAKAASQAAEAAAQVERALAGARRPVGQPEGGAAPVQLRVQQSGLYRVTYEALLAAGFNLNGIRSTDLALTHRGAPVPIYVKSAAKFGPGAYIEFRGEALDTLYTATNVYNLVVDRSLARRVTADATPPSDAVPLVPFYMETARVEKQVQYDPLSPNADPWYEGWLRAWNGPAQGTYTLVVDRYAGEVAPSSLTVGVWGMTDWPGGPDHHVTALLGGTVVADQWFDGVTDRPFSVQLPAGLVQEGANVLKIRLPGDTGFAWELVAVDAYALTYPRTFVARDGALTFQAAGGRFRVDGLPAADVVVYRQDVNGLARLSVVKVAGGNGVYSATFDGTDAAATYYVSTASALLVPGIAAGRPYADITSGSYDYVMIAHPDFIAGLAPLVAARQAQGYKVRVVNVEDVYAQFSGGVFDAQAIRDYVAYAAQKMGTRYVLLVGGDTYDYFDYEGYGAISFIPSLYAPAGEFVTYAPVDPLYADPGADGLPDLAIGRFPVRTAVELDSLVAKTLAYTQKDYGASAVLSADAFSTGRSFKQDSQLLAAALPGGWSVQEAYIDDLGWEGARVALIGAMNGGVALTNFMGHSDDWEWTFDGLFTDWDALALTNFGRPTVAAQYGCWNNWYVQPAYDTLAHALLVAGQQGAAATLGPVALADANVEVAFGLRLMPRLAQPGMTVGDAIRFAKVDLAGSGLGTSDMLLGWVLLGDPTLVVQP